MWGIAPNRDGAMPQEDKHHHERQPPLRLMVAVPSIFTRIIKSDQLRRSRMAVKRKGKSQNERMPAADLKSQRPHLSQIGLRNLDTTTIGIRSQTRIMTEKGYHMQRVYSTKYISRDAFHEAYSTRVFFGQQFLSYSHILN